MQHSIEQLLGLGRMPPGSLNTDPDLVDKYESLVSKVSSPVSIEDAQALIQLFGPDTYFGLAWALVHLIETAPGWPLRELLEGNENDWVILLKHRAGV